MRFDPHGDVPVKSARGLRVRVHPVLRVNQSHAGYVWIMCALHRAANRRKPWVGSVARLVVLIALLVPIVLAMGVSGVVGVVSLVLGVPLI